MFDPFAGTGTTLVVASQLRRFSVGIEKDKVNYDCIESRLRDARDADSIMHYRDDYIHTPSLNEIWTPGCTISERAPTLLNEPMPMLID